MKSYTDLEQSKKLAEILPVESADTWWTALNWQKTEYYVEVKQDGINQPKKAIPCWSLAALLGVLPEGIIERYYIPNLQKENGKYSIAYGSDELLCTADNSVDACFEMIIKLHRLNLL